MGELRIGIIGCGAIGQDHLHRINSKIQGAGVTGIYELNESVASKVGEQFGIEVHPSGESLIASDTVDAVLIASIDSTHEQYVLKCLDAEKPVLCEKPLAPGAEACRRIVEKEEAIGKKLIQVGYMRRYDPGYRELKEIIDKEQYGAPLMLHCAHRNASIPGFTTPQLITNVATHELDICRWLLNDEYESCEVRMPRNSRHSGPGLQDPQMLYLQTEKGILIDIEVFINCQYGYDINCAAVCEDGIASLPSPSTVTVKASGFNKNPISDDWKGRFIQAYDIEFQEWVDSLYSGIFRGPSAWDGYKASIATEALAKARDTGLKVKFPKLERPDFYLY